VLIMTAKRKIDLSVQKKFYMHNSDDFYQEKTSRSPQLKSKKQKLSKQYRIYDWFDDEDKLPLT